MSTSIVGTLLKAGKASAVEVMANEPLFCLGNECEHFVVVKAGTVRVELLSTTGQQLLLYRINSGESCVMTTSCLLGNSRYFAQAIAETPIDLILIRREIFDEQLTSSSEFREFVFSGFHERFAELMNRTAELVSSTIDQRLAAALLAYSDVSEVDGIVEQTHQQIAIDIGSAREVVSRRLAIFQQEGTIRKNRGQIEILDADRLRKMRVN